MFTGRKLEDLAAARGYQYRESIAQGDLDFTDPPWLAGRDPVSGVTHLLHRTSPEGQLILADFHYGYGEDAYAQTVAAAHLRELPAGLKDFVAGLRPGNGLHCVLRSNCIYLFPGTFSYRRSPVLDPSEKAMLLEALERLVRGDLKGASQWLQGIPDSLAWRIGSFASWAIFAAILAGWGYFAFTRPEWGPGMAVLGVILLLSIGIGVTHMESRASAARAYAMRRVA